MFPAEGWFWYSSSLKIQHNVIPCYIILFWGQNSGTNFHHQPQYSVRSHRPQQHVTKMTHPCVPFCTHPSGAGKSNDNKLPSIQNNYNSLLVLSPMPSCTMISLIVTIQFCVMSASTFSLLHSLVSLLGRSLTDRLVGFLLPSQKCFTQQCTLLHPRRNIHRHDKVNCRYLQQNFSPLYGIYGIQSQHNGKMMHHLKPVCQNELWIKYWYTCTRPAFQIADNRYRY
jgi:hypothetical protein